MRRKAFVSAVALASLTIFGSRVSARNDMNYCHVTDYGAYNYGGTPGYTRAFTYANTCFWECSPMDFTAAWDDGTVQHARANLNAGGTGTAEFFHQCPTPGSCTVHMDIYDAQGNYCEVSRTFTYE